jgi:hypothetical protein
MYVYVYIYVYIFFIYYKYVLFSHNKEWNYVICSKVDETKDYYIKQNKPSLETQRTHVFTRM